MRPPAPSRTALAALAAVSAAALLAGCSGSTAASSGSTSSSATLSVVASTNVWGDVAKTVGGAGVKVSSFISDPSQDPHSYEASSRNLLAVSDAAVIIENGGGYDDFMSRMVKSSKTEAPVINAVEVSGKKAPADGELNEHVWYDMATVARVADQVAAILGKAEPKQAKTFTDNAAALKKQLATITATEASVASAAEGTGIGITEPVPLYMTTACGLTNQTPAKFSSAIEEGSDVSPAVLADTEALYQDHKVKALIYNQQTTGTQTEAVLAAAKSNDIAVVGVTETLPPGKTFVQWMSDNVDHIKTAVTT